MADESYGAIPPPETFSIVRVIHHYHPDWEAPSVAPGWLKCLCPFHDDTRASAGISYDLDSFSCLACGVAGNYWTLIASQEGQEYAKIKRVAEGLATPGDRPVPPGPPRQPRRRVFGNPGTYGPSNSGPNEPVQAGIRGRATPWS